MADASLAALLARLEQPHPTLQRLAVAGIFQQLVKPEARSRASEAALQACTGHHDQVTVTAQHRAAHSCTRTPSPLPLTLLQKVRHTIFIAEFAD